VSGRVRAAFAAPAGVVSFTLAMTILACLTHWYTSLMYVVPVVAVGGWGWWSARRASDNQAPPAPPAESRHA
jgi:hypothetical protein